VGDTEQAVTPTVHMERLCSCWNQVRNEPSIVGKLADAIVATVGNDNSVHAVDGHTFWPQQASVSVATAGEIGHQLAGRWIEEFEPMISGVCDNDTVVGIDGDEVSHTQLGVFGAIWAELSDTLTSSRVDANLHRHMQMLAGHVMLYFVVCLCTLYYITQFNSRNCSSSVICHHWLGDQPIYTKFEVSNFTGYKDVKDDKTVHRESKIDQYTWHVIIASTNVDRFTKFLHCQIPEEIL